MSVECYVEGFAAMTESRLGKITSKRQLTIPKDFYEKLELSHDVEIIMEKNSLIVKPFVKRNDLPNDYSDLVLETVLKEGFTDSAQILSEFRARMSLLPQAARSLVADTITLAKKDRRTSAELDKDLFGEK